MARNPTARLSYDVTVLLAGKVISGLRRYQDELEMKHFLVATVGPVFTSLVTARTELRATFEARKQGYATIRAAVAPVDRLTARTIDRCRNFLGRTYNSSYDQLGLRSLALPKVHPYRLNVIGSIAEYLAAHPAVEDVALGITAENAAALQATYLDAIKDIALKRSAARRCKDAEQAALRTMQQTIRGVIKELSMRMGPDDPRWRAFGLRCPADPQVPAQVQSLRVTPQLPGTLLLEWDKAPRAARYHVHMRPAAPEGDWEMANSTTATRVTLMELPPGASLEFRVVATNDGGDAVPGEAVPIVVPALALAG